MKIRNQLLVIVAGTAIMLSACKKEDQMMENVPQNNEDARILAAENGNNPDEAAINDESSRLFYRGYLYTQSNDPLQNTILIYRINANGSLTYQSTVNSGGNGSGAPLGSQGAVMLSHNENWLFAVNAGSNSVSAFEVNNDGSLVLTSTVSSGGTMPVSVCSHQDHVYVVNSGSDNIAGFSLDQSGMLTAIPGSVQSLSGTGTMPAQIAFSPNGNNLLVTEKMTNMITMFPLTGGVAGPGNSMPSTGNTPFGFAFARNAMVVSNANMMIPGGSSCTSYRPQNGMLSPVNGAVPNGQTAACWVAPTKFERFVYVTNTASNNISSYYVSPWGSLHLLDGDAASAQAPIDICVADNNFFVYSINSGSQAIGAFHRTLLGGLNSMGITPGLPTYTAGIAIK